MSNFPLSFTSFALSLFVEYLDVDSICCFYHTNKECHNTVIKTMQIKQEVRKRLTLPLTIMRCFNINLLPLDYKTVFKILWLQAHSGCQRCKKPRIKKIRFPTLIRLCENCVEGMFYRDYQLQKDVGSEVYKKLLQGNDLPHFEKHGYSSWVGVTTYTCYFKYFVDEKLQQEFGLTLEQAKANYVIVSEENRKQQEASKKIEKEASKKRKQQERKQNTLARKQQKLLKNNADTKNNTN
jgi:hypothetical protein